MKRFSPRLFLLGMAIGGIGTFAVLAAKAYAAPLRTTRSPDPVIQWNRILLGIVRAPGAQPPTVQPTRSMAMMHVAVYDAVMKAPPRASVAAGAAEAAHDVLVQLYPSQASALAADLAMSLASVPDGPAKAEGLRIGSAAAAKILSAPMPFALQRAGQFSPGPPPALASSTYTAAFDEVKVLGEIGSTTRTAEQTQIAKFWDAPIENYWNEIAQTVALQRHDTLQQNARLFALLDVTLADSVIASDDAELAYDFSRPVTAIRAEGAAAAQAIADEVATGEDPAESSAPELARIAAAELNWTPLGSAAPDPSYPGAEAVVSAAGAAVLSSFFHGDRDRFAVSSEVLPGVERPFASFSSAAGEASVSRIYAGQDFRFDLVAGRRLGRRVGDYVLQNFLR